MHRGEQALDYCANCFLPAKQRDFSDLQQNRVYVLPNVFRMTRSSFRSGAGGEGDKQLLLTRLCSKFNQQSSGSLL